MTVLNEAVKALLDDMNEEIMEELPEYRKYYLSEARSTSLFSFFGWAKNLLNRTVLSDDQALRDPTIEAGEWEDYKVKDKNDMIYRLIRMMVGLKHYKDSNDEFAKVEVQNLDKETESNVKSMAKSNLVDKLKSEFDKSPKLLLAMLTDLEMYYSKVAGYGIK